MRWRFIAVHRTRVKLVGVRQGLALKRYLYVNCFCPRTAVSHGLRSLVPQIPMYKPGYRIEDSRSKPRTAHLTNWTYNHKLHMTQKHYARLLSFLSVTFIIAALSLFVTASGVPLSNFPLVSVCISITVSFGRRSSVWGNATASGKPCALSSGRSLLCRFSVILFCLLTLSPGS